MERLLNVGEVAQVLGVSVHTIYTWAAKGRLPLVKVGKRTMFEPREIARWVSERSRLERPVMSLGGESRGVGKQPKLAANRLPWNVG